MPVSIVDGPTIAAGESLSDAADCTAGQIIRITTPAHEFTEGANLTFEVSTDGVYFDPLYDAQGKIMMVAGGLGRAIAIKDALPLDRVWVKIRSGTPSNPVPQVNECKFGIAIATP